MSQLPVAVIGMSGRFPGADGLESFWQNLVEGRECIGEIPPERWQLPSGFNESATNDEMRSCRKAGMDPNADCYDAHFFSLDSDDASHMDPQQGMALELAWHACEDAGVVPKSLVGKEVGVFVGISTRDYDRRMANRWQRIDVRTSTGASGAIVANRISYLFGFTGPSVAVDTACSSSLASLHLACQALAELECELAMAGGVQLILSPANMIAFSRSGLLAGDGRCKPFSAKADGFVCGEGGGMVLLKPLDRAIEDGDRIRGVIRGTALNHNGRSNGLSAPYRAGQARVIRKALVRAELPAASIDYVETHTPGTLLGDAIEVQAIRDVYCERRAAERPCFVGSVKSNIGHLEAAAGIASFLKAVLMVERGLLPPSLHCNPPSDLLRLDQGSIHVCEQLTAWPKSDDPRRAGVSAFSFGGGNAHVIVEQGIERKAASDCDLGSWILVVSAASETAFIALSRAYAAQMREMRDSGAPLSSLRDICASSSAHRQLHSFRRACVVRNWEEALAELHGAAPAAGASGGIRIGIRQGASDASSGWPEIERSLADMQPDLRSALRLVALLKHLGLVRLAVDGSSFVLAACAEFARRSGMTVLADDAPTRRRHNVIVLADPTGSTDFVWDGAQPVRELSMRLGCELLHRGFSFPLKSMPGGQSSYVPLPLYPFDRQRNHVVQDELDPACRFGKTSNIPSTPAGL